MRTKNGPQETNNRGKRGGLDGSPDSMCLWGRCKL